MSQVLQIKSILSDGKWHCSTEFLSKMFIVDYRRRIVDLKEEGIEVASERCNNRCGRNHKAGMHVYKIVPKQMSLV